MKERIRAVFTGVKDDGLAERQESKFQNGECPGSPGDVSDYSGICKEETPDGNLFHGEDFGDRG